MLTLEIPVKLSEREVLERQSSDFIGPMILFQERQLPHIGLSNNDDNMSDCRVSNPDQNKSSNLRSNENSLLEFNRVPQFHKPSNSFEKEQQITSHISLDLLSSDYRFLMKSEYIKMTSLSSYLYMGNTNKRLFFIKMPDISSLLFFSSHILIFLYLPLMLSFNLTGVPLYFFIVMQILEILVELNNQQIVETQKNIISKYYNSNLAFDLIYIFGLILIIILNQYNVDEKQHQSLWILLLIILCSQQKRYYQLASHAKNYCNWHRRSQLVSSFVFVLLSQINLLTCFWNHFIIEDTTINSYIISLFSVISTISMNSTFIPQNNQQIIASIIVMICSILIYVQVMRFFVLQFYFQDNLKAELDKYFQRNTQIDIKLKNTICNEVYGQQNTTNNIIISKLSPKTIRELQKQQRYSTLQKYFQEYSVETLNKLVNCCEDIWCTPGQTVITKNVSDDSSLYFIKEGQFTVQIQPQQIIKTLNVGQSFGEYSFYSQQPRMATIICKEQGHLLKVTRQSFLQCLSYNENQIFCLSQDQLMFRGINPQNQKCYCCEAPDHMIANCGKLTYQPRKSRIIREINETHVQPRFDIVRKRKNRSINAIVSTLDAQSIDVDLFQYMFCEKWNLQKHENSSISRQEQEQDLGQEFQTESLYVTESVVGENSNFQALPQDPVSFPPRFSNQFQEGDRDLAQLLDSSIKISSEKRKKQQLQKIKMNSIKQSIGQKQQLTSLGVIPEQENSQYMSINDDIREHTTPDNLIDKKSLEEDKKQRHSLNQEQTSQQIPNVVQYHSLLVPNKMVLQPQPESQKNVKSQSSYSQIPLSSINQSEKQKSKSYQFSNLHTLSNLINQYNLQVDHQGISIIDNNFDKLQKFDVYYPEYNFDLKIQPINNNQLPNI